MSGMGECPGVRFAAKTQLITAYYFKEGWMNHRTGYNITACSWHRAIGLAHQHARNSIFALTQRSLSQAQLPQHQKRFTEMSHDPVHDWLDMAFRKLAGDKNAYRNYKKNQANWAKWRAKERVRRHGHMTDRGSNMMGSGREVRSGFNGGSGGNMGTPQSPWSPGSQISMGGPQPALTGGAVGSQAFRGYGQGQTVSPRSFTGSGGNRQQYSNAGQILPYSPWNSLNQVSAPDSSGRVRSASAFVCESDGSPPDARVRTSQTPLGDMTRSYIEGMIPNTQAAAFQRRYRSW
jgi:hypothetical protein